MPFLTVVSTREKNKQVSEKVHKKIPGYFQLYLRSILFWLGFLLTTTIFGLLVTVLFFTPSSFRLWIAKLWAVSNLWLLKVICNLDYVVEGKEYVGQQNAIVLCKHQSTWETMGLHTMIPYGRWVFKRELMFVPIFGWALALSDPISINRGSGRKAVNQLVSKGIKKLQQGKWIIMFPEGTRTAPGVERKYKIGGALLAERSGYPVLPVAHNAGEFWPRHSFIKWPGTISVRIGPLIDSKNKKAEQILTEAHDWIEMAMRQISDPSHWNRK